MFISCDEKSIYFFPSESQKYIPSAFEIGIGLVADWIDHENRVYFLLKSTISLVRLEFLVITIYFSWLFFYLLPVI
jgi:hypothetical protein